MLFFKHLFIYFLTYSLCVCMHGLCIDVRGQLARVGSLLPQVIRLGSKCLYQLDHPSSSKLLLLVLFFIFL